MLNSYNAYQRLGLVLCMVMLAEISLAAVFRPETPDDLVNAVNAANTSGNNDVIDLQGNTFAFSAPNYTGGPNGPAALPLILKTIGINPGGKLSIINGSIIRIPSDEGSTPFRLIELQNDAMLVLHNVTLEYGLAQTLIDGVPATGTAVTSTDNGGAIYNAGCLILQNTTIQNNTANNSGGGIYNINTGILDIQSSNISSNVALAASAVGGSGVYAGGGGIFNEYINSNSPSVTGGIDSIDNSTISKNITLGYGAGINNQGIANNIFSSTISYNYCCNSIFNGVCPIDSLSGGGGGIYNDGSASSLQVFNSTIAFNQALNGGGIYNNWSPSDTLFEVTSAPEIYNSTIAKNTAAIGGGGIYNNNNSNNPNPAVAPVAPATTPSVIGYLFSTIVADNKDASFTAPDIQNFDDGPGVDSIISNHSNNLVGNNLGVELTIFMNDGFSDKAGTNSSPLDPLLEERLRRNGGFTQTLALFPGSSAINAGANPLNFKYDQREWKYQRTACAITDIGAYELEDCYP